MCGTFFQVETERYSEEEICNLWWVPLAWAISLVNQMGPSAPRERMIVPKDSKDVISALHKFKKDLDMQKVRADNPLPFFYNRVIRCLEMFHSPCSPGVTLGGLHLHWVRSIRTPGPDAPRRVPVFVSLDDSRLQCTICRGKLFGESDFFSFKFFLLFHLNPSLYHV